MQGQEAGGSSSVRPENLRGVKHIIAVASGKGGVGKSSVAVNFAFLLAEQGAAVGILDADIYGPSLPTLIAHEVEQVYASKAGLIVPPTFRGVKLLSLGYLRPGEHAALRGPLVSQMVQQMLTQTEWGALDYLIIDMPPGTGDIHLTIAQSANIDAAIVVTTPQSLALVDVEKGITMFNKVQIPTIAVVENMSFFMCGNCSTEHQLFDTSGNAKAIAKKFGVNTLIQLPLDPELSSRKIGPFAMDPILRETLLGQRFQQLVDAAIEELEAMKESEIEWTVLAVDGEDGRPTLMVTKKSDAGMEILTVPARKVRLACKSAKMWDELTGEKLFKDEDIPLDVRPTRITLAGSYAVHIDWSDKHSTLMPYTTLEPLCQAAEEDEIPAQFEQRKLAGTEKTAARRKSDIKFEAPVRQAVAPVGGASHMDW